MEGAKQYLAGEASDQKQENGERGDTRYEVGQTDPLARKDGRGARWSLDTRKGGGSWAVADL